MVITVVGLIGVILQPWFDPQWAFMDPLIAAEQAEDCCSVSYGFVSNLGIFGWAGTAAICLFAGCMLYRTGARDVKAVVFLVTAGAASLWLGLDDLLLFHEVALPAFGLPQTAVAMIYAVGGLTYLAINRKALAAADWPILAIALAFLGASLLIDQILHLADPAGVIIEDSAKAIGIAAWSSFHIAAAFSLTASSAAQASHRQES